MPAFQAINLEPEENVDEQIDTTKELHVDEALKRFQNALKLHAQGPRSREAAAAAYDELFKSEIFKYREARTDYERAERHESGLPDQVALESFSGGLDIAAGGADGVAASLALALYLSYKNHGQFFLDKLKDGIKSDPEWLHKHSRLDRSTEANQVLNRWTAALDQDPSDPEVWRKLGRLAASIGSGRLKRYALEAAVELDDDPTATDVEPPSLSEGLAGEQLKEQLEVYGDEVALSHPSLKPWLEKDIPSYIKRFIDPIPFLPDPTITLTPPPSSPGTGDNDYDSQKSKEPTALEEDDTPKLVAVHTWTELGFELQLSLDKASRAFAVCNAVAIASSPDVTGEDVPSQTSEKSTKLELTDASTKPDSSSKTATSAQKDRGVSLPTRKRSQSAAGLPEGVEEENGVEKRSKRVRRRDTAHAEEVVDPNKVIADQLHPFQEADRNLFTMTRNLLENIGVEDKGTISRIDEIIELGGPGDRYNKLTQSAAHDLRHVVTHFNADAASILVDKHEQSTLGLSSFLEHTKSSSEEQSAAPAFDETQSLKDFPTKISSSKRLTTGRDIACEWLKSMSASYASSQWSDNAKLGVVQMLNRLDSTLYEQISEHLERYADDRERLADLEHLVPMLFELHVDIYERITNPNSAVEWSVRVQAKDRLSRWLNINSMYLSLLDLPASDALCIRFMWASILASSLSDKPVREHILLMWSSLRDLMVEADTDVITLPNNVVMPKISSATADREISKLTTMDFFLGLFQDEMADPVHVIDTLEPVLNPSSVYVTDEGKKAVASPDGGGDAEDHQQRLISDCAPQGLQDLWRFLQNSSTELRLFLWSRLGDAYTAIDYKTKRLSCYLRSIEMVVADLDADSYINTSEDSRRLLFLRMLRSLENLLVGGLTIALNEKTAFDIIDEEHLKSSAGALAKISCLLHVTSLCEDDVKIGLATAPSNHSLYHAFIGKLRDMQVRAWCLQYTLLKAALPQQEAVLTPQKELADYLASVHQVIGIRKFCHASNKVFLKLMRMEILKSDQVENWEDYLEQILYDLYGLKLGMGIYEIQEHDCPAEDLDKRQTLQLVGKVTILAKRMSMKVLLKSELKNTIEHMQQTVGQTKSTPQMIHNLRNFNEHLKRPVNPLLLYRAAKGQVHLDTVSVKAPEALLANQGWFFLLGMIALTRFAGVDLNRRQTPGASDDLRLGSTFLRLQLQFTPESWESWLRQAECYDYELDEAVLWTADKINKDRDDLIKHQRGAIHCYTLALSHSRGKQVETHDGDPLHDLYHKFGMRLYSSSREPFKMDPFEQGVRSRFGINENAETFERPLHELMTKYKVWKFAAKLFQLAMKRNPSNWKNPYMLSKCYWKMYQTAHDQLDLKDRDTAITSDVIIETLGKAVTVAHQARRSRNSDPIMEPHYKIASVLHKLVMRKDITAEIAAKHLSEQPFGISVKEEEFAQFVEPNHWETYFVKNLSKLREKDKPNWQHRIIYRHAKTLFVDSDKDDEKLAGAKAAFDILRESMFTKTMAMNVWKCDAERPGRHHVYTYAYATFMTELLTILDDRVNLEQLLRRLRKKGADFYHFTDLWEKACTAYVKLLRNHYEITPNEDAFKSMSHDEFDILSDRLAEWAAGDNTQLPAFTCLREAIELKRLNGGLMKSQVFDDFISDCYSKIFLAITPTLPGEDPAKIIGDRAHAKEVAARLEADAASQAESKEPKPTGSLSNILNPPNGEDTGTATPMEIDKPEAAPRARRAGIRRPDVLRKAELTIFRATEAPVKSVAKSRVGSVSSKRGSQTPRPPASDADSDDGPENQIRREEAHDRNGHEGEVDDGHEGEGDDQETTRIDLSADESDLSEVPDDYDEMPPGLIFPGLERDESDHSSGEEADSEGEGEETEEGPEEDTVVVGMVTLGETEEEEEEDGDEEEAGDKEHEDDIDAEEVDDDDEDDDEGAEEAEEAEEDEEQDEEELNENGQEDGDTHMADVSEQAEDEGEADD